MKIIDLSLPGLKLIQLTVFNDDRGFFKESYRRPLYAEHGIECEFVQDNLSFSKKDVIRGMHFQSEPGQAKLVSVLKGKILDVVVDIRPESPTFGKWLGVELDDVKHQQLFVPVGFAHGFCVLSEQGALVNYKVSSLFNPATEKTFRFDDPFIAISWPTSSPLVSPRDHNAPNFNEVFVS